MRALARLFLSIFVFLFLLSNGHAARETLSLDSGWRFHLGDIVPAPIKGHEQTYHSTKTGNAQGAAAIAFDDSLWRRVDLPHDWAIEGQVSPDQNVAQGYYARGVAWYRRDFHLSEEDRGRHLALEFDGVATHCTVWVNGLLAHRNFCGYTGFSIDITSFANFGPEGNTIAIRVDAEPMEGWWYEGAGIYRHTRLVKTSATHLVVDGISAIPERTNGKGWRLPVVTTLANSGEAATDVQVEATLLDATGAVVTKGKASCLVPPLGENQTNVNLDCESPLLWTLESPHLYRLAVTVEEQGVRSDELTTTVGFRTLRFDPDLGFFLNDQPLKIKGVCCHQDHAGVGVAVPDSLWDFRIQKLKQMGANAYRSAHNPPSREFLDACDRLGFLVLDENRNFNPTPEYLAQLEWMVKRDRNHPSVFLWSVFNEEPMQATTQGYEMVRRMATAVKRIDRSRPVTAAMSFGFFTPKNVSDAVDVMGFNYNQGDYDAFHKQHPKLPLTSTEDTSAYMTRGAFETDESNHLIGSFDDQAASWGNTHRKAWDEIATRPYIAGGFVWTGFDYHGEPTPYEWPSVSSFFGCLDLCGFPKFAFYIHQAQWLETQDVLAIGTHWNWKGKEGKPIRVQVATNAEQVELWLNGLSQGVHQVDRSHLVDVMLPYTPGTLKAVGYKSGRKVSESSVSTTGPAVALKVTAESTSLRADPRETLPITIAAVDENGRVVPDAAPLALFHLTGPGKIIGVGNGDPNSHELEKGDRRSLFHGLAQVLLQAESPGKVTLQAAASGLSSASLQIPVLAGAIEPRVAEFKRPRLLRAWRLSPLFTTRPDPTLKVAGNDMNSWSQLATPKFENASATGWRILENRFAVPGAVQKDGGWLQLPALKGNLRFWLDGSEVTPNKNSELELPSGGPERQLRILFECPAGSDAGVSGDVEVVSATNR